jgi:hypothetical protein
VLYILDSRTGRAENVLGCHAQHPHFQIHHHSKKRANLLPVLVYADNDDDERKEDAPYKRQRPRIIFKAIRTIAAGEELLFDYGENREEVLEANPWLKE